MSFPIVPTASGQIIPGIRTQSPFGSGIRVDFPIPDVIGGGTGTFDIPIPGGGGGGVPPINIPFPTNIAPPQQRDCGPGFVWSVLLQNCVSAGGVLGGGIPDVDLGSFSPAEQSLRPSMHGLNGHADTIPRQREIRRRVCGRGMGVLGKDGWCHKKIANKDRAYPKPRKALGTPGELNALATSKKFAKRLVAAEKGIKETARDLARAGGIKLGGR